ncbi:MAG: Ldh family oxidoreductase [Bacteroidales bacterium]
MEKYTYQYLFDFTLEVFMKMGCSREHATTIAEVFLAAELRDIPSHGMIRMKDYYQLWQKGRIKTSPDIRIVHETPSTAVVDGDMAAGMVPARFSMQLAIEKAANTGTGWVATRNSNHFGIAGYYSMMALERDMVGICLTNANPLVAPTFSVSPMMGTNPIAVAVPAEKQPPLVADFATTPIARGKLAVAEKKGEKVATGFVQDSKGYSSDDPAILKSGGSMLTLGGDRLHGSHKGYCLSALVDIFSAVFSGANFGPFVPPSVAYLPLLEEKVGEGTGHFFGAMRIDAFRDASEFKASMDRWIETFRAARPAEGQETVLIPGDIEREAEVRNMRDGITLVPAVKDDLKAIAENLSVNFSSL